MRDGFRPGPLGSLLPLALLAPLVLPTLNPLAAQSVTSEEFTFERDGVLGTSLRLTVAARTGHEAQKLEADVLAEIERVGRIVSTWEADGELARAVASHEPTVVSPELAELIAACDEWRVRSGNAFHPGVATLTGLWAAAAKRDAAPAAAMLAPVVARLREAPWSFDPATRTLAIPPGVTLTVDAIAKGFVLERAAAIRRGRHAEVRVLEIGGDVRVRGTDERAIAIADPRAAADNAAPLATVFLRDAAIATSGSYARGFDVAGAHRSHVLDPRSGQPCDAVLSATVIARDAASADALATILCVLGPIDGIALVDSIDGAAGLVVARDGTIAASRAWAAFVAPRRPEHDETPEPDGAPPAASPWPDGFAFTVQLELRDPNAGGGSRRGGYRRPYVAVWIETPSGEAVRTLALWIERTKWLPDLRRWYRLHRGRNDRIDAMSRATRRPGSYELAWNGLDDDGRAIEPGEYVVAIEAAREHGTYQIMRQRVSVGRAAFTYALDGNAEFAGASVSFGARAAK
ncbi:MAG: DUF2271 domain-containing protein [Planctomycetes bacterium]|nr:DUF2271 domain-containing protein [Planctomycetota bacterium]